MIFIDSLKVKKIMKICSKTHQIAPLKKKFRETCPEPPCKRMATPRVASPPPPPPRPQKIVDPPWQILHTPMNYY